MKYKLIKEYPGSPELGTEVEKRLQSETSYFFRSDDKRIHVLNSHVENNPEYWEKVNENLWWVVFINNHVQDGKEYFSAWTAYHIECIHAPWDKSREYFKTKEEADEYILYNKPCLSYKQIEGILSSGQRDVIINLVKAKVNEKQL